LIFHYLLVELGALLIYKGLYRAKYGFLIAFVGILLAMGFRSRSFLHFFAFELVLFEDDNRELFQLVFLVGERHVTRLMVFKVVLHLIGFFLINELGGVKFGFSALLKE
jgi:hypothetical protein